MTSRSLADAAGLPAPATDPAHASKRASKVNGDLTNQDGNTRRNSVNAGGAAHRALRPDRPSADRVAAQRYLRVVAAEARRLSRQPRSSGQQPRIEAQSPPTEPPGVKPEASRSDTELIAHGLSGHET